MLFDTHVHHLDERFDDDREAVLAQLTGHGVGNVVEASSDLENSIHAAALAREHHTVHAAVGLHPHSASEWDGRCLLYTSVLLSALWKRFPRRTRK